MLFPDELGPVIILTLPSDSELWKELATNTGEHSSNSGCLDKNKPPQNKQTKKNSKYKNVHSCTAVTIFPFVCQRLPALCDRYLPVAG